MSDYTLFYWSVPFRGQFVRAVLAYAGKQWTEGGDDAISKMMEGPPGDMPIPFMGPPLLVDEQAKFAIAQMPAIVLYLGETLDLLPPSPRLRASAIKIVNDANDVIDDLTIDGGRKMWTATAWHAFEPRLRKWMSLWEETGKRHGLKADAGFLLGGRAPDVSDIVTTTLWTTMIDRLPAIAPMFDEAAPATAGLCRRVASLPRLAALSEKSRTDYGDVYCGGQIEASLRKVLGPHESR